MNQPNPHDRAQRGRVLLIDNDERSAASIAELLMGGGYEVIPRTSPIGATQLIASQNISAVVVDMTSPVMHGPRFAALLASWKRVRELPVVLLSNESLEVRDAIAHLRQVMVTPKDLIEQRLVRTLDKVLSQRATANPSQSGVLAVRPGVRHYARSALDSWHAFVASRAVPLSTVRAQLMSLRAEANAIGLEQTTGLIGIALEVAERCDEMSPLPAGVDAGIVELLEWLTTLEVDKGRAFDRSLAVSQQRARLERLRDAQP